MPEARLGTNRGGATMGSITGGFWIRRAAYLSVAAAASRSRRVQSLVATNDKENIPPSQAGTARRRARTRKSPLPDWYPRSPLRDITVVVNALERRRMMRQRAAAAAVARRRNSDPEATSVSDRTPVDEALPTPVVASHSPILSPVKDPCTSSFSNSSPLGHAEDMKPNEYEKRLESSIDEIEKYVMANLKRSAKPPAKKAKHTLMSMR